MPTFQFGTTAIEYTLQQVKGKEDISIVVEWMEGVVFCKQKMQRSARKNT